MNDTARTEILATFDASNQGRLHFGELIARLCAADVEAYHVDYRAGRTTVYLPDGTTLDIPLARPADGIAEAFDVDAMRSAILGAQQGRVMYPEFRRLSQRAGCVGYTVWIAGRHVVYHGRHGQTHTERFPD